MPERASEPPPGPAFLFYPPPPMEPRIQYLATYTTERDVLGEPGRFRKFILGEPEYAELGKPYGVTMHEGKLFICDTRNGAVVIFDLAARATEVMGSNEAAQLKKPVNIAIDADGTRYVVDALHRRVMVYDRNNVYVRSIGDPNAWKPTDAAVFGRRLYVTDILNAQVVVLDRESGAELQRISRKGSGQGELFLPTNVEVDRHGNVYVSDTGNFRVLKFDRKGRLVRQFGELGRTLGRFARPKGIAIDRDDRLYVVDSAFENVQIFDQDGNLLLYFGAAGNGQGALNIPAKVEIDYANVGLFSDSVAPGYALEYLILVSSQFGRNKVNVYGFIEQSKGGEGNVSHADSPTPTADQ
jgi:DNA-binding beta-propeller fold protein YncE